MPAYKRTRTSEPYVRKTKKFRKAPYRGKNPMLRNIRTGGFLGIEKKFVDYEVGADAMTAVWASGEQNPTGIGCINAIAQGDGANQRDGRQVVVYSVQVKGYVMIATQEAQTAPLEDEIVRIALVWDTQANGVELSAENVFVTGGNDNDVNSQRDLQYIKRFKVLKDITLNLRVRNVQLAANDFSWGTQRIPFNMTYRFKKPLKVNFNGTTAVVGSIVDNAISVISCATSTNPEMWYRSRVRFSG